MSIIYKYPLILIDSMAIEMHKFAIILDIQIQKKECVLWALVNPNNGYENRKFICKFTGEEFNYEYGFDHIKTLIDSNGIVWHIFEDLR